MARGDRSDSTPENAAPAAADTLASATAAPVEAEPAPVGIVEVARSTDANTGAGTFSASDTGTFVVEDPAGTALAAGALPTDEPAQMPGGLASSTGPLTPAPAPTAPALQASPQPAPSPQSVTASTAALAAPVSTVRVPSPSSASAATGSSSSIVIPVPEAAPAVAGGTFFDPLFSYSAASEISDAGTRPSAILVDAAALKPDRVNCETGEPTVLIDLDPENGDLFPIDPQSASPALAQRLAALRVRGVLIAWISQSSVDRESEVRRGLLQSGLDPLGTDEVLLMRTADDRKQTRREELARRSCLIAIGGDTRADFHELFDFLLHPGDAASLEPLIGEGWFLIPTPLLAERTRP